MTTDVVFEFFFVNGDANHDGKVDINDLATLATNWQAHVSVDPYTLGDFTYDDVVDIADLALLATNWQYALPLPAAPTVVAAKAGAQRAANRQAKRVDTASSTVDAAAGR